MKKPNKLLLKKLLLFCVLTAGFCHFASAQTTRTVCTSGCDYTTIQAAVTAANSGDIILLNVTGAFTEKGIVLPEKSLTIRGLGKSTTILQAASTRASASSGRIFRYTAPAGAGGNTFVFEDMTIQNAVAPLESSRGWGGVFYATGALKGLTLKANRVRFYANETSGADIGGGACFYLSPTNGGLTYNADLGFESCDFDDNRTPTSTFGIDGGCFYLAGGPARLAINNSTFTNNSANSKGGVISVGSDWTINVSNSTFDGNTARNGEGGCFMGRTATWTIDNCLFKNNSATSSASGGSNGGGGVFLGGGARFRNSTFYNNSAAKGGAVFRTNNGSNIQMQLINCTFYGNSATTNGRTIHTGSSVSSTSFPLVMVNTIITNGGGTAPTEIHFTLPYSQFVTNAKNYCNSISTENTAPGTPPTFEFTSSNSTLGLSSTLASNGGTTQTLALSSNSTLINAGTTIAGVTYDIGVKDQRNFSRTDAGVDIGAYEYNGIADDPTTPTITYTALGNTLATSDRVISASITDENGIYWFLQATDLRPRIYYRKNSGNWNNAVGTKQSGTGLSGVWNFTISSATMGGLLDGDQVEYYIIAQDVSSTPAIASSPAGAVATNVNNVSTVPTPNSYMIGSTLPVKLERFTATKINGNVSISWEASREEDLLRFEVEKSMDASAWKVIGQIPATNSRHYNLVDKNPASGLFYYRLRSIDRNGSSSLSVIRQINLEESAGLNIYPNPVNAGAFNVILYQSQTLRLVSSSGIMIWQKQLDAGAHKISVSALPKGTYQLLCGSKAYPILIQ